MRTLQYKALCNEPTPRRPLWIPVLFLALAVALPPAGAWLAGRPVEGCFRFPPMTVPTEVPPFSRGALAGYLAFIAAALFPFVRAALRPLPAPDAPAAPVRRFPAWGWAGVAGGAAAWVLAWTRFGFFEALQGYTFLPLWLAYIVVVNALAWRRTGRSMLTDRPLALLALFAASAAFWWYFEYLNRFARNWHYVGLNDPPPWKYVLLASLSFSTVLPAVLGTADLLRAFPRFGARWAGLWRVKPLPPAAAALVAAVAVFGLAGVGAWPRWLYPLLWIAPLLVLTSLNRLAGGAPFFPELARGDWGRVVRFALSALICGFFWEMWNYHSLAKWIYTVPYLGGARVFEMPLPGYAGYLPFGLECAVVAAALGWPVDSAAPPAAGSGPDEPAKGTPDATR